MSGSEKPASKNRIAAEERTPRCCDRALFPMDPDDQLTSDILAALACLPFEQQADAMRKAICRSLKHMSSTRLREVKRRIDTELDNDIPSVQATQQIIEGQLALREIAEGAFWR